MEELILQIIECQTFRDTSYLTMNLRNLYLLWSEKFEEIPSFLKSITEEVKLLINKNKMSQKDVFMYLATEKIGVRYFYCCIKILMYYCAEELDEYQIIAIINKRESLPKNFKIDENILACAVSAFVLDNYSDSDLDLNEILDYEIFEYEINDYKLTKLKKVEFNKDGFLINERFYIYNHFIERSPLTIRDEIPGVFKSISEFFDIEKADFYLRLDERLHLPIEEYKIFSKTDFYKVRGVNFKFSNTKLDGSKNIIFHKNLITDNSLLMVIKIDYDEVHEDFWHVEIETLPNHQKLAKKKSYVITTFIHAIYYPKKNVFQHIDFTKNQYTFEEYSKKYKCDSNGEIKIDHYTKKENHYKIWCLENTDISIEVWCKLVKESIDDNFWNLFDEIIVEHQI